MHLWRIPYQIKKQQSRANFGEVALPETEAARKLESLGSYNLEPTLCVMNQIIDIMNKRKRTKALLAAQAIKIIARPIARLNAYQE